MKPSLHFVMGAVVVAALTQPWQVFSASSLRSGPSVRHNIPYATVLKEVERRQSLDLYLPERATFSRPPLMVFIHGGFWTLSDDEYLIGPSMAQALVKNGIAVALVRYRLAQTDPHPAQVEDVAQALSHLVREAGRYGYDPKRIYIAGHSAGAHLASLVVLNPKYMRARGLNPDSLAGVIGISGIYDLAPKTRVSDAQKNATRLNFGENPENLRAASPIVHVRPDSPPFLILSAASDLPGLQIDSRKFADALRRSGHKNVDQFLLPDQDHFSIVRVTGKDRETLAFLLDFLKVQALPSELAVMVEARRRWTQPPFSTEPFWRYKKLIRSYPIDRRFVQSLVTIYSGIKYELLERPLDRFYAIDLVDFLDALPGERIGRGDYLITKNIRNEKQFWRLRDIEPHRPVIVVGIDDEKNLFRLGVFSQTLREYSWKAGAQPPLMARPLGAFIYFLNEPPLPLRPRASHYGLKVDSFELAETDPLARLGDLPQPVYETLTFRNGCVYCHSFRGIDSKSHHNLASTGKPYGGFALPLESYPPHVWKEFLFNQLEVAKRIGASPNVVDAKARRSLYDLVVRSRAESQRPGSSPVMR